MTSSKRWVRLELAFLWVAFSFAAGYWIAKRLEPYQPGYRKSLSRTSTLFKGTSGGQP